MITFDRHTHGHTHTHTDYFLACKLHWSGELQRPDGLVSTSDFSTGQLIKLFKNDQHNQNHFRLKHWWSVRRVNLYSLSTLKQRPGQTAEPILIYLNLTKPKNQKIHGKSTCMYMNIWLFIIHPILRMVLQWNTIWKSNQISVCSFRSRDLRVWKVVPKGRRPTPPITRSQISREPDFFQTCDFHHELENG